MHVRVPVPPTLGRRSLAALARGVRQPGDLLVLEGACRGLDLEEAVAASPEELAAGIRTFADCLAAIRDRLSVAVVDGEVVAGGVALAAAATFVVASETSTFALPEVALGFAPALVLAAVAHRMPPAAARRLACWPAARTARQALDLGLVDHIGDGRRVVRTLGRGRPQAVQAVWRSYDLDSAATATANALASADQRRVIGAWLVGDLPPWFAART